MFIRKLGTPQQSGVKCLKSKTGSLLIYAATIQYFVFNPNIWWLIEVFLFGSTSANNMQKIRSREWFHNVSFPDFAARISVPFFSSGIPCAWRRHAATRSRSGGEVSAEKSCPAFHSRLFVLCNMWLLKTIVIDWFRIHAFLTRPGLYLNHVKSKKVS